jgi:hypothetical protein
MSTKLTQKKNDMVSFFLSQIPTRVRPYGNLSDIFRTDVHELGFEKEKMKPCHFSFE